MTLLDQALSVAAGQRERAEKAEALSAELDVAHERLLARVAELEAELGDENDQLRAVTTEADGYRSALRQIAEWRDPGACGRWGESWVFNLRAIVRCNHVRGCRRALPGAR